MTIRRQPNTQVKHIAMDLLHAHPQNANVMSPANMAKLRRHIEKTRRYEPLVVRPHPEITHAYQLINGHHRIQVLKSLGYQRAACMVWPLNDKDTLLLLATVNRLSGEDAPGKRLDLIEALSNATNGTPKELALLLPEDEATLGKLLADEPMPTIADAPALPDMPEAFVLFLKSAEKKRLHAALEKTDPNLALAIMKWLHEREQPT